MKMLILLAFSVWCSAVFPAPVPASEGTPFRVAWQSFPSSLLYFVGYDEYSFGATSLVLEPLLRENAETNQLEAGLAQTWMQTKNGTLELQLDPRAKFSDGSRVTAADVAATYDAVTSNTAHAPIFASQMRLLGTFKIVNDLTIVFKPQPGFSPRHLAEFFVLPASQFHSNAPPLVAMQKHFIGSGPYTIESSTWGETVRLKRRTDYWRMDENTFQFPSIEFRKVADPILQLALLKRGELDYVYVTSAKSWEEQFKGPLFEAGILKKLRVSNQLPYSTVGIAWNLNRPLFKDRRVRLALSHLLDRDRMISQLFYGHYIPATGIFHTRSQYHSAGNKPIPFDPTRADTLLREAGWIPDPKDGIRKRNGIAFSFEILGQPSSQRYLTLYQETLKNAGIEMKIQTLDWASYLDRTRNRNFDGAEISRARDIDPQGLSLTWGSEAAAQSPSLNATGFSDAKLDQLIKKATEATSKKRALSYYRQIDERIASEQPMSFLWEPTFFRIAYRNSVTFTPPGYQAFSRWYDTFYSWKPVASAATP